MFVCVINRGGSWTDGRSRRTIVALALLATLLIAIGSRAASRDEPKSPSGADRIATLTTQIDDIAATVRVTHVDMKELEKIGRDFARTYAVKTLTFLYKQPDKMRLDGSSPVFGNAVMIQNGSMRYYAVPKLKLHSVEDLRSSPSKRMSLLEYGGLIAPDTLSFMQGSFVHHETLDDQDTEVYDLTYKGVTKASHFRIWVEPKSRITVKRDWFDSDNKLKATFLYQEPHEVSPGVWMPSKIEVKNGEGIVAAITAMEDIQVGQGLKDSLFTITQP